MHHLWRGGDDLRGVHPVIFGHVCRNAHIAIRHLAFGDDVGGFRFEDDIGFADIPLGTRREGWQRVGHVAGGCPGIDPLLDPLDIGSGERGVIRKVTIRRARAPRRHAPLIHHLGDHSRVAPGVFIRNRGERRIASALMTVDAVGAEDFFHITVKDRRIHGRRRRGRPLQEAAHRIRRRSRDRLACEHGIHRIAKKLPGRRILAVSRRALARVAPVAILVVHGAAICHAQVTIKQHGIRGAPRAHQSRQYPVLIANQRHFALRRRAQLLRCGIGT